ncbi:MAG: aminoacyl-tRNA hydrolase [Alphaproteobacteria bacterium]
MFAFLSKLPKFLSRPCKTKPIYDEEKPMILLVGLGNPGAQYAKNRHNVGFMAIDRIAQEYNFPPFRKKFQGLVSEGRIDGVKIALLKPETYMNNSGQSVAAAAKFYKIEPENIFTFHDELDLEPGKTRIRKGGGNAGHNGLKSMQAHLGTPDFWRIRIGIGHPGHRDRVSPYVLGDFAKADQDWLERLLDSFAKYADCLAQKRETDYMSKITMDMSDA